MALAKLESKRRDNELEARRRKDERHAKKLKRDNLPEAQAQISRLNDPSAAMRRSKVFKMLYCILFTWDV